MKVSIVVPCYNEEEALSNTLHVLRALLDSMISGGVVAPESRLVFVDDGSRDRTWDLIERASSEDPRVMGIKLSKNRGHQNALLAGLVNASGDALISIDADLQDDVEAIRAMIERHRDGFDVVYGVRRSRPQDRPFKRWTARAFYRMLHWGNDDAIEDHADFRLLSRRAVDALREFGEVNLFLRGLVPMIGFPSTVVEYERGARERGETKYPLRKMLAFAFDGISSFTAIPLRAITVIGFATFLACFAVILWILFIRFFTVRAIPGWASTVLPIYTIGAIQILCIGVLGEYLAKIYSETKARPRYFIEKTTNGSVVDGQDQPAGTMSERRPGLSE